MGQCSVPALEHPNIWTSRSGQSPRGRLCGPAAQAPRAYLVWTSGQRGELALVRLMRLSGMWITSEQGTARRC